MPINELYTQQQNPMYFSNKSYVYDGGLIKV